MNERLNRVVELMPTLKRYTIVLLFYLVMSDRECTGVDVKQWFIMQNTGLSQRSLQLAIKELEVRGLLAREGERNSRFVLTLDETPSSRPSE